MVKASRTGRIVIKNHTHTYATLITFAAPSTFTVYSDYILSLDNIDANTLSHLDQFLFLSNQDHPRVDHFDSLLDTVRAAIVPTLAHIESSNKETNLANTIQTTLTRDYHLIGQYKKHVFADISFASTLQ